MVINMKKYPQCMMCAHVFGRSCKKIGKVIPDPIYNNEEKCQSFKSLDDEELYVEDSCCNENSRYYEQK